MTNELQTLGDNGQPIDIFTPTTVFDLERFEQVDRVAKVMAGASLTPQALKGADFNETYSNCFLVGNLAANWGLDPFSVAQAVSILYGKLVIEGKLVRAVIRKYLGFDVHYRFFGDAGDMNRRVYVSDKPLTKFQDGQDVPLSEDEIKSLMESRLHRITTGTLQKWHTKNKQGGVNDNWVKDEDKMFRERGAREWCREWAPGLMLGVYTPDEFDEIEMTNRSTRARDITPSNPLLEDSAAVPMDKIDRRTGEIMETKSTERQTSTRQAQTTNSSSRNPPSQADDDKSSGSAAPSHRAPAGDFTEFSTALLRFGGTGNGREADIKKITAASDQFWQSKNGRPDHPSDSVLAKVIIGLHLKRMAGELDIDAVKADSAKAIDTSFNGL